MELISIGKFAKMVGLTPTTLRRMHNTGELIPYHISKGGTRYYSTEQLDSFLGNRGTAKKVVGYCRVSTPAQKEELKRQIENVKTYMYAKGYQFEIIDDIGSGINYEKKGLKDLLLKINNHEVSKVVILRKDRLVGFGYEIMEYVCQINRVEIEIIDTTEYGKDEELTEELIQIITIFANKLYGQRSKKTRRLLEAVKANSVSEQDTIISDTYTSEEFMD